MVRYGSILGFVISATAAITEAWSLPLFCWSTWLAAYGFSLLAVGVAVVRLCLSPLRLPILRAWRPWQQKLLTCGLACVMGVGLFYMLSYLFGFYGIFLSVFAAMEPSTLFGPNGFINSNFWLPVAYLTAKLWPMLLGVVVVNIGSLLKGQPTQGLTFIERYVIRVHLLIVLMPFFAILAWVIFPTRYESIAIVLLMALFYFLPQNQSSTEDAPPDLA